MVGENERCSKTPLRGVFSGYLVLYGLVHAAHVGSSWSCFLWDVDDEGAHSDGGGSNAGGALDGFFRDLGWVDDASFFEVDEYLFSGSMTLIPWPGFAFSTSARRVPAV